MTAARQAGFTLIELMLVVALVGILAAIAYPAYQEQVKQTRRAEVAAVLLENAQLLERHYTRHGSYAEGVAALVSQSPAAGQAVFVISSTLEVDTYLLTARAVPGGILAGDACALYSLNHVGQRTPAAIKCWRR